ncbi:mitochondrial fission ELM1 family protein [Hyphomicrobium sp.]|uniref:mitochondrial fission ELM1 family protein n=1 Tax=Hyphomicrobium sp. TaxID=82 RepID=UPI002CBA170B|nr:mitochondrial fission ELM1 family protein [Hyphomicrobium sp.]HRN89732.1 mitochondrial fission ELM1 family protein [Hyphomicrobium sp.]HRQ27137.1 mitochondrial fission ELM1 family protein [Hyphomicrobium sp.]
MGPERAMAGAKAWIISDGKAGHEALCLGVAEALGLEVEMKRIRPSGVWKAMAPWGPISPAERFGRNGTLFAPPWPRIAFAAGRTTTPYIRALKRRAGLKTYTVVMLDPKTGPATADLFWVPQHDKRRGANVVTTLTAPHRFSPRRLAELRAAPDAAIAALGAPRVAVLVGGPNERYLYPEPVIQRFQDLVRSLSALGAGLMITTSRRTPAPLVAALEALQRETGALLWTGEGPNPYAAFLSHADAFLVTADSVNMAGEAAATGRPIYVFEPEGGAEKFKVFHAALHDLGVTRPAPERFESIETWSYPALDAAQSIAAEIEQRWQRRKSLLTGLT